MFTNGYIYIIWRKCPLVFHIHWFRAKQGTELAIILLTWQPLDASNLRIIFFSSLWPRLWTRQLPRSWFHFCSIENYSKFSVSPKDSLCKDVNILALKLCFKFCADNEKASKGTRAMVTETSSLVPSGWHESKSSSGARLAAWEKVSNLWTYIF